MKPLAAAAAGYGVALLARRRLPPATAGVLGLVTGVMLAVPPLLLLAPLVAAWSWRRRQVARRRRQLAADRDVGLLAGMLTIGLTAGLPLAPALELAAAEVHPLLAVEVRGVLRRGRRAGLAAALAEGDGRARRLYLRLARAQLTGAAMNGAVASFVDEERGAARARAMEIARRLPVRLVIPLTLLILPGFVLLTVGPSVLTTLRRLLGPLLALP